MSVPRTVREILAEHASLALNHARALDDVAHEAFHDSLTGMPNRALFMDRVSHALTRGEQGARPVGVLVVKTFMVVRDVALAEFVAALRSELVEREGARVLRSGGLKIYTTLDLEMQSQAEDAVANVLNLENDPQSALVSMTPRGEVRAMVGSRSDFTNITKARGFNYATDVPGRQPGSSFKPIAAAAAMESGISLNADAGSVVTVIARYPVDGSVILVRPSVVTP